MKVFIAATLKPVNDPRLYEKIGKTLVQKGGCSVVISGYDAKLPISAAKKVKFYPLFKFKRLSLERVWAPFKIIPLVLKEKPDVLIVASHELLLVAVILKWVAKIPIVYDIQENYLFNILYQKTFPAYLRPFLGWYVRLKELLTSRFFAGFLLAEKVYQEQLDFIRNKFLVLENKFQNPYPLSALPAKERDLNHFLYTGTISDEYGIFEAISFIEALKNKIPDATMKILGYAPNISLKFKLEQALSQKEYIDAEIRDSPVPYSEIYDTLIKGGVLLLPYKYSRAVSGRVPTRFYEGSALGLPMMINEDLELNAVVQIPENSFLLNYSKPDIDAAISWLRGNRVNNLYQNIEALWESQEEDLLKWIKYLE